LVIYYSTLRIVSRIGLILSSPVEVAIISSNIASYKLSSRISIYPISSGISSIVGAGALIIDLKKEDIIACFLTGRVITGLI
jgi:hypothetical protein